MRLHLAITVTTFFILMFSEFVAAQQADFQFYPVTGPNGKPLGKIMTIAQDPQGYMWFADQGEIAIHRFDGSRIISFKYENGNPNSLTLLNIETLFVDNTGVVWIGGSGLDRLDPATGKFTHYRHNDNDSSSLAADEVTSIVKDSKHRLWIATTKGLDRLDESSGKFIHYHHQPGNKNSISSDYIWRIYEDRSGTVWIATGGPWSRDNPEDGGLNRLNEDGSFTSYKHDPRDPASLIDNKIAAVFEDNRGVFWVGTSGDGLHTMDRKTGRFQRHLYDRANPEKLSRPPLSAADIYDKITFINGDSTGAIWIGTLASGISRYDPVTEKITHFKNSHGFPDTSSWNAFTSRDGEFWVATQNSKLYRVNPFDKTLPTVGGFEHNPPTSFAEDDSGNLWVGSDGGGLRQYDRAGKLIQQFKHDPADSFSLFDRYSTILSLHYDGGDTMWIGTQSGPGYFNTSLKKFFRLNVPIKFNPESRFRNVPDITKDRNGNIWFVLNTNGLLCYNPAKNFATQYLNDQKDTNTISSNAIVSVFEDHSGTIWAGDFAGGINRLDSKTGLFKHYITNVPCHKISEDARGTLWVATSMGLHYYEPQTDQFLPFFETESPLSNTLVLNVLEDDKHNLWLHDFSSLIKVNPVSKETFIYADYFGIIPNSVLPLAFHKRKNGHFLLGHQTGFYSFDPEQLAFIVPKLEIVLSEIQVNSAPLPHATRSQFINPDADPDKLSLKYFENNLSFSFSAIDYRDPVAIRYFTMLEGYDNKWREVKGEQAAHFFNISPGNYTFRIKAYNHEGTKGEYSLPVSIHPPWWQTWWAYLLYFVAAVIAISGVIRWRTNALRKEKKVLEEKVTNRTRELKAEKELVEKSLTELKAAQLQLIQSEKMASLGELTAGIAHEIQNPLNFVNNFSEVSAELTEEAEVRRQEAGENSPLVTELLHDIRENLAKISHHGKRADAIVKGMLQHSHKSEGTKEPTDINALCDEYLRLAYHGLRAKDKSFNAILKTDFDESIGKINIVPQDIGRVLLNIINNGLYAVREKQKEKQKEKQAKKLKENHEMEYEPAVSVCTRKQADNIIVTISDNGNGIPDRVIDKIFQPFFTTKPTGEGTGLGLSLAYDIVKAHGGEIKVKSKEGEGTQFSIVLNSES
ncbi:two-component regulator propeller domain-containing protein [Pollutibacter soli]|uniref:two-component regulator propeller domain-containing protein n=1 Tax=Pollutibacter soli TaxID=3034157 RepID=UPI003013256D